MFKLVFEMKREYFIFLFLTIYLYTFYIQTFSNPIITTIFWFSYFIYNNAILFGLNKISKTYNKYRLIFFIGFDVLIIIGTIYASIFLIPINPEFVEFLLPILFLYFIKNLIIYPLMMSKLINLAEIKTQNERIKIVEEFFLFLFFPVFGFWILMPRLNRIYNNNKELMKY